MIKEHDEFRRAILDSDYISTTDVATHMGLTYTEEQVRRLDRTAPDERVLRSLYNNNCVLVPGPPSIVEILNLSQIVSVFADQGLAFDWSPGSKTEQKMLRQDQVRTNQWLAVRRGLYPGSQGLSWSEQIKLLRYGEYVPSLSEAVWVLGVYMQVRERNFKRTRPKSYEVLIDVHFLMYPGRTALVTTKEGGVHGQFGGFIFDTVDDSVRDDSLGLVTALDLEAIGKL